MHADILTLAGTVSGADGAEQALLEALCSAARQRWLMRLRPELVEEACGEAFICAVAYTAAADLLAGTRGSSVSSFTAGEISIKEAGSAECAKRAERLRMTAERLMAPYVRPEDISFRGVRG